MKPPKRKRRTAKELALWELGGSYDAHRMSRDFHEKRMKEIASEMLKINRRKP